MIKSILCNGHPGTRNQFPAEVPGTDLRLPATVLIGRSAGPTVLLTTGIHGCEYPGTLAVIELAHELDPGQLSGRLIMIHPVNTPAFQARVSTIVPQDGRNLNRQFPGDPGGSLSKKLAWWITGLQDEADFYLDLHSGDLYEELTPYAYYPGRADERVVRAAREAALVLDVPYLVKSGATTGAYNSAAWRGTPSLLIERGGAGLCRRAEVDLYKKDVVNVLRHLELWSGAAEKKSPPPVELTNVVYLESANHGCWQATVAVGERVEKGQPLGTVFDFFKNVVAAYTAEQSGVVLYQLCALSTNPGDVLMAYGA